MQLLCDPQIMIISLNKYSYTELPIGLWLMHVSYHSHEPINFKVSQMLKNFESS